ncbi:hypothetical protein PHMEG_00021421 [Phytophthora megakarya]|uniref:Uncharacterized protein n=1 Tax=Phytophthora megakarya TaxID=4795 RepID=A0A225VMJ9_9STRA|nr:hypothetical protein PHMEG_00021421 [Phytophthora megakarya]
MCGTPGISRSQNPLEAHNAPVELLQRKPKSGDI